MANPLRLIPADHLKELPPTEILGRTRFIARGLNVVFGASGAFKSFYTLDAALTIAQSSPVVYVAAEGVGGMFKRVAAWCEHNGLPSGQLYFACEEINLLDPASVKGLIVAAEPLKPSLIIFDTLARCIPGGDENSAKDMGLAVRNSAVIQRQLRTAITWIHHTNRADRGERGSGAIRGAADAMIELSANGDSVIRVSCSKLKDDEPWVTEELRFHSVGSSGVLIPADGGDGRKLSAQEMQILEFLSLEVFETAGARAIQIVNSLNIPERKIYHTLSHLKRELHVQHDSKGDPYRLTDSGRKLICKNPAKLAPVLNFSIANDLDQ
jgi:hypothetical protein